MGTQKYIDSEKSNSWLDSFLTGQSVEQEQPIVEVKKEPEIIHQDDQRFLKLQNENEEKSKFKKQLFNDAKKEYLKAKKENTDPKLIQSLRQECRSWLKPY